MYDTGKLNHPALERRDFGDTPRLGADTPAREPLVNNALVTVISNAEQLEKQVAQRHHGAAGDLK